VVYLIKVIFSGLWVPLKIPLYILNSSCEKTIKLSTGVSLLYCFHFRLHFVTPHTKCLATGTCIHSVIRIQKSLPHDIHKIACLLKFSGVQYFIIPRDILCSVLEGTNHAIFLTCK
jgi:hypothetical protein